MLQIEHVPLDSLVPADYNPRRMPDAQMAALMRSLEQFGWVDPVVVNQRSGVIVGGHQRVEAAKRLQDQAKGKAKQKWALVPVTYVDLDEGKEKALNVALNKISGEFDHPKLAELLQSLDVDDLALTGFGAEEIDDLLASLDTADAANPDGGGNTDPDHVPDAPAEPITVPGDIWILGRHRLMCGDSTVTTDVERLMAGVKADMVWTDPPYNVAYTGKTKDALTIENDEMDDQSFFQFLQAVYKNLLLATKPGGAIYVAHADSEGLNFRLAMKSAGWLLKQCLIWVKQQFVMGRQDYHWRHEPILYGWAPGAAHTWTGDRKQDTVLEFDRPHRNAEHPTMKPVDLIEYCLGNSSKPKSAVLDLFGGSGSTLIAAERTGRSAYLMELDPKYCDVIVRRWEQHTGQKARLEGSDAH